MFAAEAIRRSRAIRRARLEVSLSLQVAGRLVSIDGSGVVANNQALANRDLQLDRKRGLLEQGQRSFRPGEPSLLDDV